MRSAKATLRQTVEALNDEEARQILEFAQRLLRSKHESQTFQRLVHDPAFHVPQDRAFTFRVITPIHGKGMPAAQLLEQDRR